MMHYHLFGLTPAGVAPAGASSLIDASYDESRGFLLTRRNLHPET